MASFSGTLCVLLATAALAQAAPDYGASIGYANCMYRDKDIPGGDIQQGGVTYTKLANKHPEIVCHAACLFDFKYFNSSGCNWFTYDTKTDLCTFKFLTDGWAEVAAPGIIIYNKMCMDVVYVEPKTDNCLYPGYDAPYQTDLYKKRESIINCNKICNLDPFCNSFSYGRGTCAPSAPTMVTSAAFPCSCLAAFTFEDHLALPITRVIPIRCYFKSGKPDGLLKYTTVGFDLYFAKCGVPITNSRGLPSKTSYPASPTTAVKNAFGDYDLGKVLGMNFRFFESLWAGALPSDYRIGWRFPGHTNVCSGRDGGSYEAGNHIESMLAMAQEAQLQASSILYNRDVYLNTKYEGKTNLYWATRELRRTALWLAQAYESDTSILIGVGADFQMFKYFGRAENAPYPICQEATPERPASDHVAQAAIALSLASIVFRKQDPAFATNLLNISKKFYETSKKSPDTAVQSGFNIGKLYPSYERKNPAKHQFVAACSLYQNTNDIAYYNEAKQFQALAKGRQNWPVLNWDNPYWLGMLCLARSAPSASERSDARDIIYNSMLKGWFQTAAPLISRTPDGFPYWNTQKDAVNNWGMLRDTSSTAYMGLFYADLPGVSPAQAQTARCFAKNVVEYILGNNRLNQSYIVGYTSATATTFPRLVHDRDAAARIGETLSAWEFRFRSKPDVYEVTGGMVSGPNFQDGYIDIRDEYSYTEIALDFNAAWSSLVAALSNVPDAFWSTTC